MNSGWLVLQCIFIYIYSQKIIVFWNSVYYQFVFLKEMQNTNSGIPGTGRLYTAGVLHLYIWCWGSCRPMWRCLCWRDVPAGGTTHNEEPAPSAPVEVTRWVRTWSAGPSVRLSEGPAVALIAQKGALPAWERTTSRWRCSPVLCTLPPSPRTCKHGGAYFLVNDHTNLVCAPFRRLQFI